MFLNAKFLPAGKKAAWLDQPKKGNPWLYFNHATLKELKLKQADVERALADWYNTQPGIERAFTGSEMWGRITREPSDLLHERAALSSPS